VRGAPAVVKLQAVKAITETLDPTLPRVPPKPSLASLRARLATATAFVAKHKTHALPLRPSSEERIPAELLRSRTAQGIRDLSAFVDPSYGVLAALRSIAKSPRAPGSHPPMLAPGPSRPLLAPRELKSAERLALADEVEAFAKSLPPADSIIFRSGHRLSVVQRDALLLTLTPEQRTSRGLRFSDEKSTFLDTPECRSMREAVRSDAVEPTANVLAILMDAWHLVDPLFLELAADVLQHGMNLAYNGDRTSPTPPPAPNMTKRDAPEHEVLVRVLQGDIDEGRASGWFPTPPFPNCRPVPAGLVEKDFSLPLENPKAWRAVKNYSSETRGNPSTNDVTDKVVAPFPRWTAAIDQFVRAGKASFGIKFDKESAFPSLAIRLEDRCLTASFIPGKGWTNRLRGDFGHKTCGFRWEVIGRLLSTLYHTMSYRLRSEVGAVVVAPPPARVWLTALEDPFVEPPPQGWCCLRDDDLMLSAPARRAFGLLDREGFMENNARIDLRDTQRWVDDFVRHYPSFEEAWWGGAAFIFLHARYGIKLKPSKFENPKQHLDFGGVDFHGEGSLMGLSSKKVEKIGGQLDPILQGRPILFKDWQKLCGSLSFAIRAHPVGKHFSAPFFTCMAAADKATQGITGPADAVRAASFWKEALLEAPPASAAFSRSQMLDSSEADVIVHSDWAPEKGDNVIGIFVLSHGVWCFGNAPAWFSAMAQGLEGVASSPALEGLAESMLMATFPDIVRGKNVLHFLDNIPWIQATMSMSSPSPSVNMALQLSALGQIKHNTHIVRRYVPTDKNLSDSLSHRDLQRFRRETASVGLSACLSPAEPRFSTPPSSWLPPSR
jgi:hypothetical protein